MAVVTSRRLGLNTTAMNGSAANSALRDNVAGSWRVAGQVDRLVMMPFASEPSAVLVRVIRRGG